MEWQEARSAPVCIAPFHTNVVNRGVKPGQTGSRTRLTGDVRNSIGVNLALAQSLGTPVCTLSIYSSSVLYGVWARYMHCKRPVMSRQYRFSCVLNTFDTVWVWFLPLSLRFQHLEPGMCQAHTRFVHVPHDHPSFIYIDKNQLEILDGFSYRFILFQLFLPNGVKRVETAKEVGWCDLGIND